MAILTDTQCDKNIKFSIITSLLIIADSIFFNIIVNCSLESENKDLDK